MAVIFIVDENNKVFTPVDVPEDIAARALEVGALQVSELESLLDIEQSLQDIQQSITEMSALLTQTLSTCVSGAGGGSGSEGPAHFIIDNRFLKWENVSTPDGSQKISDASVV